ncbi:MAG: SDR family oxidoreductase [Candidatus Brocadiaceae bacterium]|nr:SDR family oxidoreductase [Candidatus Brocadiaceae bacterium]
MDLFDLTGRRALITGSSRGLGRVLADGLARAGAEVVVNGRRSDAVREAVEGIQREGLRARAAVFDVTVEEEVEEAVAAIERDAGPVDVLVNNAGVNLRGLLADFATGRWHELMAVNLHGVFHVCRAAGRRMVARGAGKVINIASLMSEGGRPGVVPYAASKGAVKMLTRALAVEWGPHNVQVNAIGPGYFRTEMTRSLCEDESFDSWVRGRTPMRRWGEPAELIGAAVFLASDASSFVNGQVLYVDGGWLASL